MRLLLDLQGAQGSSRHSGLGRYSLDLARGLVRGRVPGGGPGGGGGGGHELLILLNGLLRPEADAIEAEFAPLLGAGAVQRFFPPEGCAAGSDPHHPGRLQAQENAVLAARGDLAPRRP